MKLTVVIVNYNVRYFLEQALYAVRKAAANLPVEVYVVDNNSVDDSVKMVKEQFPEVILIENKDNPGFSIANNQAINVSSGEYVLLLNPDTVIEEDTFEKVVRFMDETPDAGGLGVKMIDGSGKFLPESKRGFPSPWVAFCKIFGLSTFFPKSKKFNRYHLGYLDKDETNEVEVLAGAFMLLRRSALDKIGLLDETFFMYGEDIDLSYRILKGGYKNYYFADTTIIHYKGESTKKGSLNYVRTFYNAMIIFARKHFTGNKAKLYIALIQFAIYFRAILTVVTNFFRKAYLPILDAGLIVTGLLWLKDFWAVTNFNDPNYYADLFTYFNIPLYTSVWLLAVFFSGGYDYQKSIGKVLRGITVGSVLLAAIYGFLNLEYRTSRMLLLLGAVWTTLVMVGIRMIHHFIKYRNFKFTNQGQKNFVIVGTIEESERVQQLIYKAQVNNNFIGTVHPADTKSDDTLGTIQQLDEICRIYKIDEVIFCSKNVSSQNIMKWMINLGTLLEYKIVPEESLSIIGSSSKNTAGELYTIEVQFKIQQPIQRRNKRLLDVLGALILLVFTPILLLFSKSYRQQYFKIWGALIGQYSLVGYHPLGNSSDLPKLKPGVFHPLSGLEVKDVDRETADRVNFFYAKDYTTYHDFEIVMRGFF